MKNSVSLNYEVGGTGGTHRSKEDDSIAEMMNQTTGVLTMEASNDKEGKKDTSKAGTSDLQLEKDFLFSREA